MIQIELDIASEIPSAPGTPGGFSQSGSSSIERDQDSDDDEIHGPNKRQKEKARQATDAELQDQDIPTIALTPAPPPKTPKIILHTKSQQKQDGPRGKKLISTREKNALKKAAQKRDRKERKKQAANPPSQHLAPSTGNINLKATPLSLDQVLSMKTLTI
jgi:hypothetical protein